MIISDQEARLAAQHVEPLLGAQVAGRMAAQVGATRSGFDGHGGSRPHIPPELMRRILVVVESTPETRSDRVLAARARLELGTPKPHEIAEKIIARAISDALR